MSNAFIKGVKEQFPNAETTFDPFHVIKQMNDALGKIWAEKARLFPEILKMSRYLFLKNPENLSADEQQRLDEIIANQNLKSTEAYLHKLNLQNVYFAKTRPEAEVLLYQWYKRAEASSISVQ